MVGDDGGWRGRWESQREEGTVNKQERVPAVAKQYRPLLRGGRIYGYHRVNNICSDFDVSFLLRVARPLARSTNADSSRLNTR